MFHRMFLTTDCAFWVPRGTPGGSVRCRARATDLVHRGLIWGLNRFGGGGPRHAANPGLTPSFRRSLPETGCLSQGLPHGKRYAWPCPPKTVKHPRQPPAATGDGKLIL